MTRVEPPNVNVSRLPPPGIKAEARLAISVKEKAEMTMVRDEILTRRIGVATLQFVAIGIADAMDDEIEVAPFVLQSLEHGVDRGEVLDVAGQHERRS